MDSFRYFQCKAQESILYGYVMEEDSLGFRIYVANGDYYANYNPTEKVLTVEEGFVRIVKHPKVDLEEITRERVIEICGSEDNMESEEAVLKRLFWGEPSGAANVREFFEGLKAGAARRRELESCRSEDYDDDIPF